jgi:hypothetical protein
MAWVTIPDRFSACWRTTRGVVRIRLAHLASSQMITWAASQMLGAEQWDAVWSFTLAWRFPSSWCRQCWSREP